MISMANNNGDGPLLKTYGNMLHNKLLPSTYNGNITVVGITSVKLTSMCWTLFFCSFWFYVCWNYSWLIACALAFTYLRSVQEACHDHWVLTCCCHSKVQYQSWSNLATVHAFWFPALNFQHIMLCGLLMQYDVTMCSSHTNRQVVASVCSLHVPV